jgi:hypothetical protein
MIDRNDRFTSLMSEIVDREARELIRALEEQAVQRDHEIAELTARLCRVEADFARLAATVEAILASCPLPSPEALSNAPVELPTAPEGFASRIVADFPALFAEFSGKRFTLLWRGSGDGFGGSKFHHRCDGHAPTLTLIQDTKGNIFGGFTPVEWESREWNQKYGLEDNRFICDPSRKSFLFT